MPRLRFVLMLVSVLAACKQDVAGPVLVDISVDQSIADWRLEVTASSPAAAAGDAVTFEARLLDADGLDVTDDFELRTQLSPALGVLSDGDGVYRFTFADRYTYFAAVEVQGVTLVAAAGVDVTAGAAASLRIDVDRPLVVAGDIVTVQQRVYDAWGNPSTGTVSLSVSPTAPLVGQEITPTVQGNYVVTGTLVGTDATDDDHFRVEPAQPASLDIWLSDYDVERGQGVVVHSVVHDVYGNAVEWPITLSTSGVGSVAWADFVRFEKEGIFTVYADIPEYGLHDEDGPVLVDSSGPNIRVATPARGAEIPQGGNPTVLVSGSVSDALTGVLSVTVNGSPATLMPGGLFEYVMTPQQGLNTIDVVAVDGDGNVSDQFQTYLWGDFLPMGDFNEDALVARLNQGGIDTLESFVSEQLDLSTLFGGLLVNLWTSPQWCFGWDIIASVCGQLFVDVTNVSIGQIGLDLDTHNPTPVFPDGFMSFAADVYDIAVTITLTGRFTGSALGGLVSFDESADIDAVLSVDRIHLDTDLGLSVDANNDIQVAMANTVTTVTNIQLSIPDVGFLDVIFGSVFNFVFDLFEPLINAALGPIVQSQLPGLVESALGDLEIATVIDLMGTPVELAALPQTIRCDDDGMTIALESSLATTPGSSAPTTLGSWRRNDSVLPSFDPAPDFALGLADNFVNQLLHVIWQAGVLDLDLPLADLGLDLSQLSDFLPLTYITLETAPLLPPVVGPSANNQLGLNLGDMLVNVWGDPGGVDGLMMQLAVTLQAGAYLDIDGSNLITFGLDGTPTVVMDFVTSDFPDLDGEITENLMGAVIDLVVPQITTLLDGIGGIPIPELPGFTLGAASIEREQPPAYYITASGDLVLGN